jgi:hypothetical protein
MVKCGAPKEVREVCPNKVNHNQCRSQGQCEYQSVSPLIGDRVVVQRTPESDRTRITEFSEAMFQKWQKGRSEHGVVVRINPWEEAMKEAVDMANYAMDVYYRIKRHKEQVESLMEKEHGS